MKKILTVIVCICLVAAFALSVSGCNMVTVNKDRLKTQVVATVDGIDILRPDYDYLLNQYLYDYYGYTENEFAALDEKNKEGIRNIVLDKLVERELEYREAVKEGFALSEEEEKAVKDQFDLEIREIKQNYKNILDLNENLSDEEKQKKLDEYLNVQMGESFDYDNTLKYLCRDTVVRKYEQSIKDTVEVTEDEIKDYYDANIDNQQLMLDNGTYNILTSMSDSIILLYPDDVRRVQAICVGLDKEASMKIEALRKSEDQTQADEAREEALADISDKAAGVYSVAKDAETSEEFADLIDENSDGTISDENRDNGYLLYSDMSKLPIPEEAYDAALLMENIGDISEPIATDYGYYILRLASFPDKVVSYEEAHDQIYDTLLKQKQDSAIADKIAALKEKASVVSYYDRLKDGAK